MLILVKSTDGVSPLIKTGEELHDYFNDISSKKGEIQEEITVIKSGMLNKSAEKMTWVMSDGSIDRADEICDPNGWLLENFKANPLLLWSHNRSIPAIGRMDNPESKDGVLRGEPFFNPKEIDPFGWSIGERAKIGTLNAGSVGFQPLEWEWKKVPDLKYEILVFTKSELHEFSICNVPCNPFALSEGKGLDGSLFSKPEIISPDTKGWNDFFTKTTTEPEDKFKNFFNQN